MKITEIRYTRRFNVAPYEHEEYTIAGEPAETEGVVESLASLKQGVADAHAGVETEVSKKVTKTKVEKPDTTKGPKSGKKAPAKKVVEDDEEEDEGRDEESEDDSEDETEDSHGSDTDSDDDESDDSGNDEEEDEEPKKKVVTRNSANKATEKKVSGKKKAGTTYDRANDTHKKLMAEEIKALSPKFFTSKPNQEKARTISKKLHGSEFLDSDGDVVASFKKALSTAVKAK